MGLSLLYLEMRLQGSTCVIFKMLSCWMSRAAEVLDILPTQAHTSPQNQTVFWGHICSTIVSLFFFTSCLRSSTPEANCFWASGEWEDFRPGLLLHLPGHPGRAGRVRARWSRRGTGWVPVLSHWRTPYGLREDGDTHRAAYRRRSPGGC